MTWPLIANQGPNAITFIISSECFPTHIRATSYGISAAAGKVGALIGQDVINPLANKGSTTPNQHPWINRLMLIYALFMLCGLITSLFIPETKRKTLEELAGETDQNPAYKLPSISGFLRPRTPDRRRRAQREED
jgi:PHS family inorganic phosphate transporter-like MFS transporter